ncbi:MAG: hypothetical protein K6T86_17700 [Pirellulales bacterium]|nr:hypothetical protein [Pirellulales bacterium]
MHEIPENDRPHQPLPGEEPLGSVRPGHASAQPQSAVEELLSAYLDGELREADRQQVERLLEGRPELGQLLEELRTVRGMLASLPRVELEADFYQTVLRQVEREMLQTGEDATHEEAPTLSASTLPAITLSLPPPDERGSTGSEEGAVRPDTLGPAETADAAGTAGPAETAGSASAVAPVDRVAETMPAVGEVWKAPLQPANAALPAPQARGPGETGRGSPADGRRVKWLSGLRLFRSRLAVALASGLAAMLLLGVFWATYRQAPELAQGLAALPGDAPHAMRAMRAPAAGHAPSEAMWDPANMAPDDGAAEKAEAGAVPGPVGPGAVDKDGMSEDRAGRRGSEAARRLDSARAPFPEEEGSPPGTARQALGGSVPENNVRQLAVAEAVGALVVHCEVASDGASLQAFREVLQGADIALSDSDAVHLRELLLKLAPRLQNGDMPHAAPDDQSDQSGARQEAQPADQQKQASPSSPPPFEVWYVAAAPEQVALVLAAMAQQPEVFRHAQVLASGGDSVPLQEWQHAYAPGGPDDAEATRQNRPVDKPDAQPERFLKRDNRAQAARSALREERQDAPAEGHEEHVQEENPPAPAGQAGADSGEAPAGPAQSKNGAASAPAGEDKAPADEGEEGVAGEETLAGELPSRVGGGGLGGVDGGPERLDGHGGEGLSRAYAVRWSIGAPDLADAVQQFLGKLVPLLGDLVPGNAVAAPLAPAAPLPAAPRAADKLEDADSPDNSKQPPSGNLPKRPGAADAEEPAAEPEEPRGVPDAEAGNSPARKATSGEAAEPDSAPQAVGGTEGRRAEGGGAKGRRSRGSRRPAEPSRDLAAAQAPAGAENLSANGVPQQQQADAADRAATAEKDEGQPAALQMRGPTGYQQVLFVLRIVPAEPATADEAE